MGARLSVLHVVPALGAGGAAQALLATAADPWRVHASAAACAGGAGGPARAAGDVRVVRARGGDPSVARAVVG